VAIGKRIGVIKACDQRMIQLRQRPLLHCEAFPPRRRHPGVAQHFDRHTAPQVLPFGQIHHAHAAFAEKFLDAVRSNLFDGRRGRRRL
jgi:hypothetical protein